jgi:hypothetical protein
MSFNKNATNPYLIATGNLTRFPQRPRVRSHLDVLLPPEDPELGPWTAEEATEAEEGAEAEEDWPPDEPWQPHWNVLFWQPVHLKLEWFDGRGGLEIQRRALDRAGYYQDNDQLFNLLTDFVPFEDWIELNVRASADVGTQEPDRYEATNAHGVGVLLYDRDSCEQQMFDNRIEELDEGARLQDLFFDHVRAQLRNLNEEDMMGLLFKDMDMTVDAETLIGRVPDRHWTFSIHRRVAGH